MKLIIAGGRDIGKKWCWGMITDLLQEFQLENISEVVSGACKGIDDLGEWYAFNMSKSVKKFPADWDKHGKAAGPIRNKEMAEYADALLLIWNGKSRGSASMKREMEKLGKPIYEVILRS